VFEYHWHCKAPTNILSGEGDAVIKKKYFVPRLTKKDIDNAAISPGFYMVLPNLTKDISRSLKMKINRFCLCLFVCLGWGGVLMCLIHCPVHL